MLGQIYNLLPIRRPSAMLLAAIAAAATVFTIAMPLVAGDNLDKRMKAVAVERERIRARERERMAQASGRLPAAPPRPSRSSRVVEQLQARRLARHADRKEAAHCRPGFAGRRRSTPFSCSGSSFRSASRCLSRRSTSSFVETFDLSVVMRIGIVIFATYIGIKLPEIYLRNADQQAADLDPAGMARRARPALICAESGVSIEQAFRRVSSGSRRRVHRPRRGTRADHGRTSPTCPTPKTGLREPRSARGSRPSSPSCGRPDPGRTLRHADRAGAARSGAGEPRHADERGREEGGGASAEADRADDPVLPARSVRRDHDPGDHPGLRVEVRNRFHLTPPAWRQAGARLLMRRIRLSRSKDSAEIGRDDASAPLGRRGGDGV
jgi:hypothetical protein